MHNAEFTMVMDDPSHDDELSDEVSVLVPADKLPSDRSSTNPTTPRPPKERRQTITFKRATILPQFEPGKSLQELAEDDFQDPALPNLTARGTRKLWQQSATKTKLFQKVAVGARATKQPSAEITAGSLADGDEDGRDSGAQRILKAARQKAEHAKRKVKGLPEMDSPAQLSRSSSNVAENQRRLEELFGETAPGARPGTPASSKPYSPSSPLQPRKNSFGRPAVRFAAPAAAPKSPGPSNIKALDV